MTQENQLPGTLNPSTTPPGPNDEAISGGKPNEVHFINVDTGEVTTVVQGSVYPAKIERLGPPSRLDPYIKNPTLLVGVLNDFETGKQGVKISDFTNAFRGIDWTSKRGLTGMASETDGTKQAFADGIIDVLMFEPKQKLSSTTSINEVKTKFLSGILNDMYAETDPSKQGVIMPEDTYAVLQMQELLLARALARNPYKTQGKREVAKVAGLFSGKEPCAKTSDFFFYVLYEATGTVKQEDELKLGKAKLILDTVSYLKETVSDSKQPESRGAKLIDGILQKYHTIEKALRTSLENAYGHRNRRGQDEVIKGMELKFKEQLPSQRMPKSLVERAKEAMFSLPQVARKALYAQLINTTAVQLDQQLPELMQLADLASMTETDVRRIHSVILPTHKLRNVWWNSVHLFSHPSDLSPIAHETLMEVARPNGCDDFVRISIDGDKRPTDVCIPAGEPETTAHALHFIDLAQKQGAPITRTPFTLHGDSIASQVVKGVKQDCHIFRIESEGVENSTSPLRTLVEATMEDQTLYGEDYIVTDENGEKRYDVRKDLNRVFGKMEVLPDFAPDVYELGEDPTVGGLLERAVVKPGIAGYEIILRLKHNLTVYPSKRPPDIVLKIDIADVRNEAGDVLRFADEEVRTALKPDQRDLLKYVGLKLFESSSQMTAEDIKTVSRAVAADDEVQEGGKDPNHNKETRIYRQHIGLRRKAGGKIEQGKPTGHARDQWKILTTAGALGISLDDFNTIQLNLHRSQGGRVEDFRYWTIGVVGGEHINMKTLDNLRKSKAVKMLGGTYNGHLLKPSPKFAKSTPSTQEE